MSTARPSGAVEAPTRWTLASALAGWEACLSAAGCELEIEWPNDLYHEGRKLAGTLIELRSLAGTVQEILVGTGFNVHHAPADFPTSLATRATSLAMVTGETEIDREALACAFVERLGARVAMLEGGRWDEIRDAWSERAPRARGARVRIQRHDRGEVQTGMTRGVDDRGALCVERPDGSVTHVRPGDTVVTLEG